MRSVKALGWIAVGFLMACAPKSPHVDPMQATKVSPGPREQVTVDTTLIVLDSSGSLDPEEQYPYARALAESFVNGMPDDVSGAGAIVFGGSKRQTVAVGPVGGLDRSVGDAPYLSEYTPLAEVVAQAQQALQSSPGRAAIILISDGVPIQGGLELTGEETVAAGQMLVDSRRGEVCFHTVQIGDDERGLWVLENLAALTSCGTYRTFESLRTGSDLLAFQRQVYIGPGLPPVAAPRPSDLDGDGVLDRSDRCPNTPAGATVNSEGCFTIEAVHFQFDSTAIQPDQEAILDSLVGVLRANPTASVRLSGYTDDTGPADYNVALSKRRASAVESFLVSAGVDSARIQTDGKGATNPMVPNDSDANRGMNRRTEVKLLR